MTLDDKTNNHMYKVSENLSSCCIDRLCSLISAVSRSVYLIYVMFFLSYITGDCRILICCSFFYLSFGFMSTVYVFVDHPSYHRPRNLYGDKFGAFGDNQVRSLLC